MSFTNHSALFSKPGLFMCALLVCNFFASQASAASLSGSGYDQKEAMRASTVKVAVIEDLRKVTIQQQSGSLGQYGSVALGGVLGGVLGNSISNGSVRTAATAVLAAAGGAIGYKANEHLSRQDALELIVRMQDGRQIAVTQPVDQQSQYLAVGDRVRLIQGANLRVVRIGAY